MNELDNYRTEIDSIDEQIIKLLAGRQKKVMQIAAFKSNAKMKARQPGRHQAVIQKRQELGLKYHLEPGFVLSVWQLLMSEAIRAQEEILNGERN